jgi:4-amino-4-deoxychorismate lyase
MEDILLIESLKIFNRQVFNIEYHNERMNRSRSALFGANDHINLKNYIILPSNMNNGLFKCRVIYSQEVKSVDFSEYNLKNIHTLTLIFNESINYSFKYEDRGEIDNMMSGVDTDDIIIIKNGFVTDSSAANLIFFDGKRWITPTTYLLAGTMRKYLLDKGIIDEGVIKATDIKNFIGVKLINAIRGIDDSEIIKVQNIK